ncbi:MAG: hypothetical protein AAF481_08145 [Acidobacteriota bacterium]
MDHPEDLEDLLAELAAHTGARHPSVDEWISYAEGRLPVEERAWLDLHRERCDECREVIEELLEFPHRPGPYLSQDQREAAWASLRKRLGREPTGAGPGLQRPSPSRPLRRTTGRILMAACLLFGLWGLWAVQRAQRILDGESLAGGNLALVRIVEVTPPVRGVGDGPCVPGDRSTALALNLRQLAALGPDEPLVAEIVDRRGAVRLRREGLRRQGVGGSREILALPASRLEAGPHVLRLSARGGRDVDTFHFEICSS